MYQVHKCRYMIQVTLRNVPTWQEHLMPTLLQPTQEEYPEEEACDDHAVGYSAYISMPT